MREITRRKLIQSTSALAVTGSSLAGKVGASGSVTQRSDGDKSISASEVGVSDQVSKLMREGKDKKAIELLEENNVEHYSTKKYTSGKVEQQEEIVSTNDAEDGVTTQGWFSEQESYILLSVWFEGGSEYQVLGEFYLAGNESNYWVDKYARKAKDAFGFDWENDDWEAVDPDRGDVKTSVSADGDYPTFDGDITITEFSSNYGVVGEYELNNVGDKVPTFGTVETKATEVDSDGNIVPIKWRYDHFAAPTEYLSSVSASIGPAGFSVDFSNATRMWSMDVTAGPGEVNTEN